MLKVFLNQLQKLINRTVEETNSGIEAINEIKHMVFDDSVNYLKRNRTLVDNEIRADLGMITRRKFIGQK